MHFHTSQQYFYMNLVNGSEMEWNRNGTEWNGNGWILEWMKWKQLEWKNQYGMWVGVSF